MIVETPDPAWTVYAHIAPNGKMYVGITSQRPEDRWHNGKGYRENEHFTNAINKYGWENFKHEILYVGLSHDEAVFHECRLIDEFNLTDKSYGYNKSSGGDGYDGHIVTEETRQKMSDATHRRIENNGGHGLTYGIPKTEDWKKKISAAHKKLKDIHAANIKKYCKEHPEVWSKAVATRRVKYGDRYFSQPSKFAKPVQCIESGCIYESVADFARRLGISMYYAHKYLNTGELYNGCHYKYANKGEFENGTIISESQERTSTD